MSIKHIYIVLGMVILMCPGIQAKQTFGLNPNHPYGVLSNAYVTPHIKWANPYYKGKIRTLVIAPIWSQRETVELAQRLSLNYTPWMTSRFHQAVSTNDGDPAANSFLVPTDVAYRALDSALAKQLDVIVIGKQQWTSLPEAKRFAILKKVAEGTGLVYVNPKLDDSELSIVFGRHIDKSASLNITNSLPLAGLPGYKSTNPQDLLRTGKFGKGRVAALVYPDPGMPNYSEAFPCLTPIWDLSEPKVWTDLDKLPEMQLVPYEYYQALVAKSVLWASGKDSAFKLNTISLPANVSWPANKKSAKVTANRKLAGNIISAVVRDRWQYGQTYPAKVKKSAAGAAIGLPELPAGMYFLDVWLKNAKGEIIDWTSKAFKVTSGLEIVKVELDRKLINPREPVTCKAAFSRPLRGDEKTVIAVYDNYGRKIQSGKLSKGTYTFRIDRPVCIMHSVRLCVLKSGKPIAERVFQFPVRARLDWDNVHDVIWASGNNHYITLLMLKKLYEEDEGTCIDIPWQAATSARNIGWSGMAAVPYTARYGVFGKADGNIIPTPADKAAAASGPMASPETLEGVKRWGLEQSAVWGPYGPYAWTHGDETYYSSDPDIDWSSSALEAFRQYLRGSYGSLDALNADWKASYKDWNEVMPLTLKEARETGNYAPWVEHKRSSNLIFADFFNATGKALVDDPGARAGFDGGGSLSMPNSGADWWILSKKTDILHSYIGNSDQMEIQRSFPRKGQVRGMWYGTYGWGWAYQMPSTPEYNQFFTWYSIFHQMNSTWFWLMGAPGNLSGYAGDLTNLPFFESRRQELAKIRSGIGTLILACERKNDKIAIHYSEASRIADSVMAERELAFSAAYAKSLVDFNKTLEDAGLQYQYVSYEQIENDMLNKGGYKVLIMPHSWAVSSAEADAIRRFVENGGTIIADIVPGVLNGHGTKQHVGMLADLFPSSTPGTVTTYGKGKTILIGNAIQGYGEAHMREAGWRTWPEIRKKGTDFVEHVIKPLGIAPETEVTPTITDMPPTEVHTFQAGNIEIIGLLRQFYLNDMESYRAKITFPRKAHLYDVMNGKYIGFTDTVRTSISYKALLYALLPYKVEGIGIKANVKAALGKAWRADVALKTSGNEKASLHCFRVEVTSPKGILLKYLSQNVMAANGRASFSIPFAINDSKGIYKVRVRDAATGISAVKEVKVQ